MSQATDTTESNSSSRVRTFPMLLTAFEDYMLWDDRPDYPMAFMIRLELEGEIDREAFTATLPKALERHPLLQANVRRAKRNEECWVAASEPHVQIDWGSPDKPIELPEGERIDLQHHVALRIWVRGESDKFYLILQFHHAACDGIGAYQFVSDWFWFYAERLGMPIEHPLPPVDVKQIKARHKTSLDLEKYRMPNGKMKWHIREALTYALGNMLKMAAPRESSRPRTPSEYAHEFPGNQHVDFDKDQYKALRHVGEARAQSINELLLERLLITLNEWNDAQGVTRQGNFAL